MKYLALAALLAASACGGGGGTSGSSGLFSDHPYNAVPPTSSYTQSVIAIPNVPGTTAWSIDIGLVDGTGAFYYLADKTNFGVDVVDLNANTYVTTISGTGKLAFQGNTGVSKSSGPNGILFVGTSKLYANDGNNTVKVIDLGTRTVTKSIALGGKSRADEGSYDPDDNIALVDSDSDSPVFQSFINTTTDTLIGTLKRPDATGMEDSIYVSSLHAFVQAVPVTKTNKNGEIDFIDPVAETIRNVFPMPNKCGPTGLALGPNGELLVACSDPGETYILDIGDGHTLAQINQAGGGDQSAYDPATNRFYVSNSNSTSDGTKTGAPTPVFTVIDAGTKFFIENVPIEAHAHSLAAYNGRIFVPRPSLGVAVYK